MTESTGRFVMSANMIRIAPKMDYVLEEKQKIPSHLHSNFQGQNGIELKHVHAEIHYFMA